MVVEDRAVGHEHRHGPPAARPPGLPDVDHLEVALLGERDPRAVQRPAGLLAVVADRDRQESRRHGADTTPVGSPGSARCARRRGSSASRSQRPLIPGAKNPAQARRRGAMGWRLTADEAAELEASS